MFSCAGTLAMRRFYIQGEAKLPELNRPRRYRWENKIAVCIWAAIITSIALLRRLSRFPRMVLKLSACFAAAAAVGWSTQE